MHTYVCSQCTQRFIKRHTQATVKLDVAFVLAVCWSCVVAGVTTPPPLFPSLSLAGAWRCCHCWLQHINTTGFGFCDCSSYWDSEIPLKHLMSRHTSQVTSLNRSHVAVVSRRTHGTSPDSDLGLHSSITQNCWLVENQSLNDVVGLR